MSTKSDIIYRPVEPSDLPKIQAGTLKAFYQYTESNEICPAILVTTNLKENFGGFLNKAGWLLKEKDGDSFLWISINIVVDITPEKRYAIWNHELQRFLRSDREAHTAVFTSKIEGEVYIQEMAKRYAMTQENKQNYYVVEWEIKKDD